VARAAIESGVATRDLDLDAYAAGLRGQVHRSSLVMRPVFEAARSAGRRIVFAEGEEPRVLRAVQAMREEGMARPILVGRPEVVAARIEREGLSLQPGEAFDLVNPESDERYRDYWGSYHAIMSRRGVSPDLAKAILRTNSTAIAAVMVHRGEADSLICGTVGAYSWHLKYVSEVLARDHLQPVGAMSLILLDRGPLFVADTHVHLEPDAGQIAQTMIASARHARRFGLAPKVALCSGSQFGSLDSRAARAARDAIALLDAQGADFEYEGEMHTDAALDPDLRERLLPGNRLRGRANILVYAGAEPAGAARNLLKSMAEGIEVGPVLMGMGNRAHIVTPGVTVRGLLNISALAATPVESYG
jgi:malate dehydrogenase (oxaloacetate-decarboxylating)(NADP+)